MSTYIVTPGSENLSNGTHRVVLSSTPRRDNSFLLSTKSTKYGGNPVLSKARRNPSGRSTTRGHFLSTAKWNGGSIRSLNTSWDKADLSFLSTGNTGMSYTSLRDRALARRALFEDPAFPADERSLKISFKSVSDDIKWKRPHEISKRASFISYQPCSVPIEAGMFGRSWLVPALSCLTLAPSLLSKCIPEDQAFDESYAGIFRFRFWRFGEWIEIIIDDRLPTRNGQLVFLRNSDPNEFWAALLEKAYAKLYGSYGAIQGTQVTWALQDLTGGVQDGFLFRDNSSLQQQIVNLSMTRATLVAATIPAQSNLQRQLPNGLVTSQAYTVTGYAEIPFQGSSAILVRLKNPWDNGEWQGPWCESSNLWETVKEDIKHDLGHGNLAPNEFWLPFQDFSGLFTSLEVCYLTPEAWNFEPKLQHRQPWRSAEAHRHWRRGFNAGGGKDSVLMSVNTQIYVELQTKSHVVLSLMQKYRPTGDAPYLPCECLIFQAPQGRTTRLQPVNLDDSRFIASTGLRADRNNARFFTLPAGCYVIMPVTSGAGVEGRFYLRIFTDDPQTKIRELDDPDMAAVQEDRMMDMETRITVRRRFLNFCNRYEEIDGYGLKEILSFKQQSKTMQVLCCEPEKEDIPIRRLFLSAETCKAAITIVDKDMNGRISFEEFVALVNKLTHWQSVFSKLAVTNGSVMDSYALRNALRLAGFSVSNKVLEALILRFAAKDFINLEGFINSVVKLHVAHQQHAKAVESEKASEENEKNKYLRELLRTAIYS